MLSSALHHIKPKAWLALAATLVLALATLGVGVSRAADDRSSTAAARVDYFLKIDGVAGDATDKAHKDEIVIESYQWSDGKPAVEMAIAPGGGPATGKVTINPFHFKKTVDKSSPQLLQAAATGKHFPKAKLSIRKAGGNQQDYLVYELKDVIVSSYQTSGQAQPEDEFTLTFSEAKMSLFPAKADGSLSEPIEAIVEQNQR